ALDLPLVTGLHALKRGLPRRQHRAGADHAGTPLGPLGGHALVADLRPGFQLDRVTFLRAALDRVPAAALRPQVLDHGVDVGLGDLRVVAHHFQLRDVDVAEGRHHLEGRDVLDLVGGIAGRLQLRVAGDLQLVLADGRVERLTQQLLAGLGTDLLAEALLDHAARHLARAEALEPGGPGDLAQAL